MAAMEEGRSTQGVVNQRQATRPVPYNDEWYSIEEIEHRLNEIERHIQRWNEPVETTLVMQTVFPGDSRYVKLDGSNEVLWVPADGTQDISGNFNLAGAAYQYKIGGAHALSMPGTHNLLVGEGAGAALLVGGTDHVIAGYGAGATITTSDGSVVVGPYAAAAVSTIANAIVIGPSALRWMDGDIFNSVILIPYTAAEIEDISSSVLMGYNVLGSAASGTYVSGDIFIGAGAVGGTSTYEGNDNLIVGTSGGYNLGQYTYRNVGGGSSVFYSLTTGSDNTAWGYQSAYSITTVSGGVYLGHKAGYYETAANKLFIDNAPRTNEADGRVKALVYGIFDADTANQYFTINGHIVSLHDVSAPQLLSTIAIGTAPLIVTSTTLVTNLNADLLDGQEGTYYLDLGNATGILVSTKGGTGVNNAGTFTNPANSSITGGGTIALGGYTLTVPATGTAALATGIAGGQTFYGGTAANNNLALAGTTHATRTTSFVLLQPIDGKVGIGLVTPLAKLHISGVGNASMLALDSRVNGKLITVTSGTAGAIFSFDNGGYFGLYAATSIADALDGSGAGKYAFKILGPTKNVSIGDLSYNTPESNYKFDVSSSGSSGTIRFYDQKAATGSTNVLIREGAGQSTNEVFGVYANDGTTGRLVVKSGNIGVGVVDPDELLELYKVGIQLKLSGGAADFATFGVAADGALTITTVDADAAEADIVFAPDGVVISNANVNITGMMRQTATWHAYGGFEDQAETIACGVGDWNHITNVGNDLWNLDEGDGISEAADVFTLANTGDYTGILSLSVSATMGKDFHIRVYNNTQARVEGRPIGGSTTGAGNEVPIPLPLYIEGTAGDEIQFEIMSADGTDPVIDDALFTILYVHD